MADEAARMDERRMRATQQAAEDLDARAADQAGTSLNGWIAALAFSIAVLIAIVVVIIVGAISPKSMRWIHTPAEADAASNDDQNKRSSSSSTPAPHPSLDDEVLLGGGNDHDDRKDQKATTTSRRSNVVNKA